MMPQPDPYDIIVNLGQRVEMLENNNQELVRAYNDHADIVKILQKRVRELDQKVEALNQWVFDLANKDLL